MTWAINLINAAITLIPYFLRRSGATLLWSSDIDELWVTEGGLIWGSDGFGRHLDWVSSIIKPIQDLNNELDKYANHTYYLLHLTGQVIYLEHYLNDLFDSDLRDIYIEDDSLVLPPFLYLISDYIPPGEMLYLYPDTNPIYLYNQFDYFTQGSFIVYVPIRLLLSSEYENRIRAAVNRYKQAGVSYKVINY